MSLSQVFSFLLAVLLLSAPPTNAEKVCGIALSTGHDLYGYTQPKTQRTIRQIKSDSATHVQISAYTRQVSLSGITSSPITDDNSLRQIIRKVHRNGLKVFLKPTVSVESKRGAYIWRGHIKGSDKWFTELYIPYITNMARLAQQEHVDIFSLGSEFREAVPRTRQWIKVIRDVRAVYKGKLTYIANHDSYMRVKFFKYLDFISISAYYKMLPGRHGPSPSLARTRTMFEVRLKKLENWRKRAGLEKMNVLVAEVGWQSKGNGVVYRQPWNWRARGRVDFWDQSKMYEAFFSVFLKPEWSMGAIIWHYELENSSGRSDPSDKWYTPQNKPAQLILRKYFRAYC